jgi:two-component system phosphate regulon sensor histidine kinase PhoR
MDSLEYKFTRKGRNVSWRVETEETEQVRVMADRERILQVLSNLVDNAIKYGDSEGAVVIRTLVLNDKVEIQVIDDGPGIDPEHLNKVFRRFYRIDKSRSRDTGGTGLGLAICKHLIEAHNERIWVNSEVGKGTVFHFSLPVVSYPDAEEPAA